MSNCCAMMFSIESWWLALSTVEQVFWGISIVSSALFAFQLLITLIGLDSDLDLDLDDMDGGVSIISLRTIVAFLLFFGWTGVMCLSNGLSPAKTLMVSFLIGFLAMIAVAYIFALVLKLQESGTVDLTGAVAAQGEVYVTIPKEKKGKGLIHISIEGKMMEFEAISKKGEIETGSKVEVLKVMKNNLMLVKPI